MLDRYKPIGFVSIECVGQEWGFTTYAVWLEPTSVRERLPVNALSFYGAVEEDVGQAHDVVVDDTTTRDQTRNRSQQRKIDLQRAPVYVLDQPIQDLAGRTAELHERQAGEAHDHEEAVKRYTILGAVTQELGRATFESQSVQATSGAVRVGVASAEDRCHHQGVDNVGENRDAHVGHGDDIRRCSS